MAEQIRKSSDDWDKYAHEIKQVGVSVKTGLSSIDLSPIDTAIYFFMDGETREMAFQLGAIELTHRELYDLLKTSPKFNHPKYGQ